MLTMVMAVVLQTTAVPVLNWVGADTGAEMCTMGTCQCDGANACSCMADGHHHNDDGTQHLCGCSFPDQPEATFLPSLFDKAMLATASMYYHPTRQLIPFTGNPHYSYLETRGIFRPPQPVA